MNNIYVDELPKSCKGCPLHNEDNGWCQVLICYTDDVPTDCPLKPLTDRLAEERKKVVQEIGQQLGLIIDGQKQVCCDGDMTADKTIMAVLDQIDRGE